MVLSFSLAHPSASYAHTVFFSDSFPGTSVNPELWYMPTWTSPTDGTYVGRTQFRVTQSSPIPPEFPPVRNNSISIPLQTYNPTPPGNSFYGTELITKQSFPVGKGLDVIVRARMSTSGYPGIVGGIYLYALQPGSVTIHDEIDFEFLTNRPDQVQTNIYANEPLGLGHPQFIPFTSGSMTDAHTYEIKWLKDQVSWSIDGKQVRSTTQNIPAGPMSFYLNDWAPDQYWPQAYSPSIQPASSAASNTMLENLVVESVLIQSIDP
jgi:hypothetical protein